jgi:hypothetical protein
MKQFTFEITHKTSNRVDQVRATAANPTIARAQVVLMYGQHYNVADLYCHINPAHHTVGEIDCTDFPASDTAWLQREASQIEAK